MRHSPVSTTLVVSGTINLLNSLTYLDTQNLTTTLNFPVGSVTQTTTVVLTPTSAQGITGLAFAGHAFDLEVYRSNNPQSDFTFRKPVTVTIHYSDRDVRRVLDERQLTLRYRDEGDWQDAICASQRMTYTRDIKNNMIHAPICHLSRFALFGPTHHHLYLPLVFKTWPPSHPRIMCTVAYTTTDTLPYGNHNFDTAAPIANYINQSLLAVFDGITFPKGGTIDTVSDFYRLDNADVNYQYTVEALPDKTINYDLGIIVYDKDYQPIITDSNPFDGNLARVQLSADDHGPYFFEIFQRSQQCRGGTYSLILYAATPTPIFSPPTSTPTSTPTPRPTSLPPHSTSRTGRSY